MDDGVEEHKDLIGVIKEHLDGSVYVYVGDKLTYTPWVGESEYRVHVPVDSIHRNDYTSLYEGEDEIAWLLVYLDELAGRYHSGECFIRTVE